MHGDAFSYVIEWFVWGKRH